MSVVLFLVALGFASCKNDNVIPTKSSTEDPTTPTTKMYTVSFNINGGTGIPTTLSIPKGAKLSSIPTPTKTDSGFQGWYTDAGTTTKFDPTQAINANTTLYAKWITFNITNISTTEIKIADMDSLQEEMIVPAIINGKQVVEIDSYSGFIGMNTITKKVTLPEGLKKIGDNTFLSFEALTSITIPASVTNIGKHAFGFCPKLTLVTINATSPPSLSASSIFDGADANFKIKVPADKVSDYQKAPNWSNLSNKIISQ
ncbi:MAG: InlB B-repeat-containing protein [Sphingobacteriaceae bacterium]|nr:InlB B-repeat-containing protein [Sphingobacteriaceae bacterium]